MNNQRIIVTGGAGFIGSHLVNALIDDGHRVSVIDDFSAGKRENIHPAATLYQLDMCDTPALARAFDMAKPEYVYHLAFNTDAPRSVREPSFDALSIVGSANVFHQSVLQKVRRVIFTSSGFVYGNADCRPTPESASLVPSSPYSVSKAATEQYLKYFNVNFGLPYITFRFATVFGPRQSGRAMDYYLRCIKDGASGNIWGDGTKTRAYVIIDDIIRVLAGAWDVDIAGVEPVFNISSGKETALNELYAALADLLGHPENHPTYLPDRPGEIIRFCLDSAKAKRYLGWEPAVAFKDGLARTVQYYLK